MSVFLQFIGVLSLWQILVFVMCFINKFLDIEISRTASHKVHETYLYWYFWNTLTSPFIFYFIGKGWL